MPWEIGETVLSGSEAIYTQGPHKTEGAGGAALSSGLLGFPNPGAMAGLAAGGAGTRILFNILAQLTNRFKTLETVTETLVQRFQTLNPAIKQIAIEFDVQRRKLDREWGRAIEPLVKQQAKITLEWQKMYSDFRLKIFKSESVIEQEKLKLWQGSMPIIEKLLDLGASLATILNRIKAEFYGLLRGIQEILSFFFGLQSHAPKTATNTVASLRTVRFGEESGEAKPRPAFQQGEMNRPNFEQQFGPSSEAKSPQTFFGRIADKLGKLQEFSDRFWTKLGDTLKSIFGDWISTLLAGIRELLNTSFEGPLLSGLKLLSEKQSSKIGQIVADTLKTAISSFSAITLGLATLLKGLQQFLRSRGQSQKRSLDETESPSASPEGLFAYTPLADFQTFFRSQPAKRNEPAIQEREEQRQSRKRSRQERLQQRQNRLRSRQNQTSDETGPEAGAENTPPVQQTVVSEKTGATNNPQVTFNVLDSLQLADLIELPFGQLRQRLAMQQLELRFMQYRLRQAEGFV